jgi:hypothetical protein
MEFDKECYLAKEIPECRCETPGKVRPNIIFHDDAYFNTLRSDEQEKRFIQILEDIKYKCLFYFRFLYLKRTKNEYVTVIEVGCNPQY